MGDRKAIVGTWAIDVMYGMDSQEDTFLVFRPDGTGWISFEHYVPCELDTFTWAVEQDGRIHVRGVSYTDGESERDSDLDFTADFTVQIEQTPSGKTMNVLTFDAALWCDERKWALLSADPEHFPQPKPLPIRERPGGRRTPWWKFW